MIRTWRRGPFPSRLEWNNPTNDGQSDVTHDPWWAEHWAKLGCEVTEITETQPDDMSKD